MNSDDNKDANAIWEKAIAIQRAYWTFDKQEKDTLLQRFNQGECSFEETYRLHHLVCMEICETNTARELPIYEGVLKELSLNIISKLLDVKSPYRAFYGSFWQNIADTTATSDPRASGRFVNVSITHLGALEVMTFDENQMPNSLRFIPFDRISGGKILGNSLLRPGLIYYEFGRPADSFWVPLLYGTTFAYGEAHEQAGNATRFIHQFQVPDLGLNMGIGIGQQDFLVAGGDSANTLLRIGSISEFTISLEMDDPKFDEKCIGRGLDPVEIRKQHN